ERVGRAARRGAGPGARAAAKEGEEAPHPAEGGKEGVEASGGRKVGEPPRRGAGTAQSRLSVAIVRHALLGIVQDLVRFRDLLEALFRPRLLVAIGVRFHGELAIRFLDGRFGCVRGHAQYLVVVSAHSSSCCTRRLVCSTSAPTLS